MSYRCQLLCIVKISFLAIPLLCISISNATADDVITIDNPAKLDLVLTDHKLYIKNLNQFKPDLSNVTQPPSGCCAGPFIDITTAGGDLMYSQLLQSASSGKSITITIPNGNTNNPITSLSIQ